VYIVVAVLELLTLKLETMTEKSTEHQESTNLFYIGRKFYINVFKRWKYFYSLYTGYFIDNYTVFESEKK
jgi:hypothetical protein